MTSDTDQPRNRVIEISQDALPQLLRSRFGLIIGPAATIGPEGFADLNTSIAKHFSIQSQPHLMDTCEALVSSGVQRDAIVERYRDGISALEPVPFLHHLATPRWLAVLSVTPDLLFEQAFALELDRYPDSPNLSRLPHPEQPTPPHTIPALKILGEVTRDDFVLTRTDYRACRPGWRTAARTFADHLHGAPVLCIGVAESEEVFLDLLAELVSSRASTPGPIYFIKTDPLVHSPAVRQIASNRIRLGMIDTSISGFTTSLKDAETAHFVAQLPYPRATQPLYDRLTPYGQLVVVVNQQLATTVDPTQIHRLRNLLFSPSATAWAPFATQLDFPRSITSTLLQQLRDVLAHPTNGTRGLVLTGPSACGKTTVLKRLAYDIADDGYLALWFRPYLYQDAEAAIREIFSIIAEDPEARKEPVVLLLDDPLSPSAPSLASILAAAQNRRLISVPILAMRTTDLLTHDPLGPLRDVADFRECPLPSTFDTREFEAFPDYLVKLHLADSIEHASLRLPKPDRADASDVLSMLFLMLPETQATIRHAVRDEYLRLGDLAAFSRLVIGELAATTELLKSAYELVAVANHYGTPLPIEVLVSALGVAYTDWLDAAERRDLAWGLLYSETSHDEQSIVYFTRNAIVTRIIVDLINGGQIGYSGELARLRTLLRACNGSAPAYRNFATGILLPTRKLDHLQPEEGDDLFAIAADALPHPDRTLVHQRGIWQRVRLRDPALARQTLHSALDTPEFPYATQREPIQHIYTSLAANEVDAIRLKRTSPEDAKTAALGYLERARSLQFLNMNAVHVQARLVLDLLDHTSAPGSPDSFSLVATALSDLDRSIIKLTSPFADQQQRQKHLHFLEDIRDKAVQRVATFETLNQEAENLWRQYHRQDAFVVAARLLLNRARRSNTGSDYNTAFGYVRECETLIEAANDQLSPRLVEVGLHIYYLWAVRRPLKSELSFDIDWPLIEKRAAIVCRDHSLSIDPFNLYLRALALAHHPDWAAANAIFSHMRQLAIPADQMYQPRDVLLHPRGTMRQVQGTIVEGSGQQFIHVPELGTDFRLDRDERWRRPNEIEHVYIRFRYAGPLAAKSI